MSDRFADLDRVLDEESWEWLNDNYPALANVVARSVASNITPQQIRARVMDRAGAHRIALAQRCESAARWLASEKA